MSKGGFRFPWFPIAGSFRTQVPAPVTVQAVQAARHGNIFIDTSSAMNMTPGLIEWGAKEVGAERLLYGTDSPCYFAPMPRARIDHADLSLQEKQLILRENAIRLFQL